MNEVITDALLESIEAGSDAPMNEVVLEKVATETMEVAAPTVDPSIAETKTAAYAEQESTVSVASMEATAVTPTTTGSTKKARKAKAAVTGTPATTGSKRVSTAELPANEAIVHKIGNDPKHFAFSVKDAALDEKGLEAKRDEFLTAANTLAKKVKEKAVNLLDAAINGKDLSVYTEIALRELITKGKLTSAELKSAYRSGSDPYTEGTASAQQSQMFQLLPAVGIATGGKSAIELNGDSTLAQAFKAKLGL